MSSEPSQGEERRQLLEYRRVWLMNYWPESIPAFLALIPFYPLMIGFLVAGDYAATHYGVPILRTIGALGTALVACYLIHFMDRRCDDPVLPWNR